MNEFSRIPRLACFLAALMLLGLAFPAPAAAWAGDYYFSVRMGQHLLLQLVIPPLILLGLPALIPASLDERTTSRPFDWMLKRPVITWLVGSGGMWAWHAPLLCNAAVRDPATHLFQAGSLLLIGTAFWWPIVGPAMTQRLSPLAGIVYLFTACLGCTIMGIIIAFAPPGLYLAANLPGALNDWQFAAPEDQRIGGLLMWVPGCLIYAGGIMGLLGRWYGMREPETCPVPPMERTL
jgi:cytochrome c oxidase assembly factor CtaG